MQIFYNQHNVENKKQNVVESREHKHQHAHVALPKVYAQCYVQDLRSHDADDLLPVVEDEVGVEEGTHQVPHDANERLQEETGRSVLGVAQHHFGVGLTRETKHHEIDGQRVHQQHE